MKRFVLSSLIAVGMFASAGDLTYVSGDVLPLIGRTIAPDAAISRYQRLPDSIRTELPREYMWTLGRCTSGMALRFASDSPYINAKWTNTDNLSMNHMTDTGIRGLDLYTLQPDSTWRFVNTARPVLDSIATETTIVANMTPGVMRDYMLYLPLYDGIADIQIGYDGDYTLAGPVNPSLPAVGNPIVVYGTSITQGGCASRPGMAYTNQLMRKFNTEVVNLGFSGNGQLDLEIAPVVAAVENPALFILDFCPNVNADIIAERMLPFVAIIREKHPFTPILFVENPIFPNSLFDTQMAAKIAATNEALGASYDKLGAGGDQNLFYLKADGLIGNDGEATVDGIHYTDLGLNRYARLLESAINAILSSAR